MFLRYSPPAIDPSPSVPLSIARPSAPAWPSFTRAVTRYRTRQLYRVAPHLLHVAMPLEPTRRNGRDVNDDGVDRGRVSVRVPDTHAANTTATHATAADRRGAQDAAGASARRVAAASRTAARADADANHAGRGGADRASGRPGPQDRLRSE